MRAVFTLAALLAASFLVSPVAAADSHETILKTCSTVPSKQVHAVCAAIAEDPGLCQVSKVLCAGPVSVDPCEVHYRLCHPPAPVEDLCTVARVLCHEPPADLCVIHKALCNLSPPSEVCEAAPGVCKLTGPVDTGGVLGPADKLVRSIPDRIPPCEKVGALVPAAEPLCG